jgi:HEPN domain-containing protein
MLRRPTSETDPGDWFQFAAERLRGADVLWISEGLTALGIEALHESLERFLKGYLVATGWRLVKTHDLTHLIREALVRDARFQSFLPLAEELTEDFFSQHYPGGDLSGTGANYETMRQQAGEVVALIQTLVPEFFRP